MEELEHTKQRSNIQEAHVLLRMSGDFVNFSEVTISEVWEFGEGTPVQLHPIIPLLDDNIYLTAEDREVQEFIERIMADPKGYGDFVIVPASLKSKLDGIVRQLIKVWHDPYSDYAETTAISYGKKRYYSLPNN